MLCWTGFPEGIYYIRCMRITRITTSLLIFLLGCIPAYSQSWPSSLLWRISGNGLDKPSYLYGTMHLKDRRLFYFGDSLYQSLENSAGFAMEIDPNEMMDSVYSRLSADNSPLIKSMLSDDEYSKIAKKLEKKLGLPAEKITRKKLVEARRNLYYNTRNADDMKTMVDLYLYDIAQRQGKWVGGIEDVSDQLTLSDEMGNNINVSKYLEDFDEDKRKAYLEKMITLYVDQDVNKINEMVSPAADRYLELVKRNIKMARRMDSLAHIRNCFFAVGAAHLSGDSGVISLLRARGFNVEPVFSSKKIAPEKYVVKESELKWQRFAGIDSAYTIEMPGKPSELNMFGNELRFKVYTDMANNKAYMAGFLFIPDGDSASVMERMMNKFSGKEFKKLDEKKVMHLGMNGLEMVSLKDEMYYRFQLFVDYNKFYMLMHAAGKREQLNTADANHFFQSFSPNVSIQPKLKNWSDYSDSLKAFSISVPGRPITKRSSNNGNDNVTYSVIDLAHSAYYLVVVSQTQKGYIIADDSLVFNPQKEYYKEKGFAVTDTRKFELGGFPAMSFTASGSSEGQDIVCKLLVVSRGNRSYTVAAITQKGMEDFPDISRFMRSFSLLPYHQSAWSSTAAGNNTFSTWAPSAIELPMVVDSTAAPVNENIPDVSDETEDKVYTAFEAGSATTYHIVVKLLSKYYRAVSDSSFFENQFSGYYMDTASYQAKYFRGNFDSLVYKKPIANGYAHGYELLVKNNSKSYYKRVRILYHGDSSYHLYAMAPYAALFENNSNRFFEDFRFSGEEVPTAIFTNKTALILSDLQKNDSATKAAAVIGLINAVFDNTELPLLQQAFMNAGDNDSAGYYSVPRQIAVKMEKLDTTANLDFVKSNYTKLPATSGKRMMMLEMLADQRKLAAVKQLKEILVKDPPLSGFAYSIVYDLKDSLLLAAQLFPEVAGLFKDTIFGPGFISVATELADSGLIGKSVFTDNKAAVLRTASRQLAQLKKSDDEYFSYGNDVISALTVIGDPEAVTLLYGLLSVKDAFTKEKAAIALIKLNKPVAAAELRKIAADMNYRTDFYTSLKKLGKESLYPKEFLSQQKFAEAYLYLYASSEDDMDASDIKFKLLGEKEHTANGVTSRYYIYKLLVNYDDEKYEYPAVCGPFDINRSNVGIPQDAEKTTIFYEDELKKAGTGVIFEKFLQELQTQ